MREVTLAGFAPSPETETVSHDLSSLHSRNNTCEVGFDDGMASDTDVDLMLPENNMGVSS